jgi:tRNA threonylcarbamoyladenosine biosynthesis protein TsaB
MILALDTSTSQASLAIWDPADGVHHEKVMVQLDRAHFGAVFEPLGQVVNAWRNEITGLAVGLGPGSYTAVRVGLAAMQGLALSMGLPLLGRNSLEIFTSDDDTYAVLGDARRRTWALSVIRDRMLDQETMLLDEASLANALAGLRERGISLFSAERSVLGGDFGAAEAYPCAALLARQAVEKLRSGAFEPTLEPIYLRDPFITYPKGTLAPVNP